MLWTNKNSLTDIQHILENIFSSKMRLRMKAYEIIDLSETEYYILAEKVKLINRPEDMSFYCLSVFVGWITAYKFGLQKEYYHLVRDIIQNMPQHHTKIVMDSINTNCYDYQIDTFGKTILNSKDLDKLAKIHAGF